ncbi:MAG TPA: hypothetical protein VN239_07005 [Nitrososphaera sp.]|nr:hypothetical protein [Nitrososphaera sp.]
MHTVCPADGYHTQYNEARANCQDEVGSQNYPSPYSVHGRCPNEQEGQEH